MPHGECGGAGGNAPCVSPEGTEGALVSRWLFHGSGYSPYEPEKLPGDRAYRYIFVLVLSKNKMAVFVIQSFLRLPRQ